MAAGRRQQGSLAAAARRAVRCNLPLGVPWGEAWQPSSAPQRRLTDQERLGNGCWALLPALPCCPDW